MTKVLLRDNEDQSLVLVTVLNAYYKEDVQKLCLDTGDWDIHVLSVTKPIADSIIKQLWEHDTVDLSSYNAAFGWSYVEETEGENENQSDTPSRSGKGLYCFSLIFAIAALLLSLTSMFCNISLFN